MHINLQAILTRVTVSVLLVLGASAVSFAQEISEEADDLFDRRAYYEALEEYRSAYGKADKKTLLDQAAHCAFYAGECLRILHKYGEAQKWYDIALGLGYVKVNPMIYLLYGDILRDQEDFYEAIEWYGKYGNAGDRSVADARIKAADLAALYLDEPQSRYIVEPMYSLNSEEFDFAPMYSDKKNKTLIFASSRKAAEGTDEDPITGEAYMDLFYTTQDKKERWSEPQKLGNTICTPSSEGSVAFDNKFKTMYFTRCVEEGGSNLACDIYFAPVVGNEHGASQPLMIVNREEDDTTQIGHPAISPEGNIMVFASDLAGGYGGKDLWYIKFDKDSDAWGTAINLGPSINSTGDDMFPTFRKDGSLYFSSNGRANGLGGFDLCKAEVREGEMVFAEVEVLPYPLNSASDDMGIVFNGMTSTGVFSSNRPGGKGQDDLYSFRLPPMEFCYRAYVYNYETHMPVSEVTVELNSSEGELMSYTADSDGFLGLCDGEITEGVSYNVQIKKEGYTGTGDRFSTIGLNESTTFAREYFVRKIELDKEYKFPTVLYPLASADLLIEDEVNSADSLNYLVKFLTDNENLVIQLEAHTDSRGTNASNKELSQRRAETCVNFLVKNGIDEDRLVPVGHGEDFPKIPDSEIAALAEEDREAAHGKNRRTVFKILRYDYVPSEE